MTTAHETPTNLGFPSPFSAGNAAPLNGLEYPLERDNSVSHLSPCAMNAGAPVNPQNGCFAAGEYHVPSHPYAPRTAPYQHDDLSSFPIDPNPLPERCQFMFSDGRQCTMPRSDVHPSLCRFHAEREEQLFGSPVPGGNVVGASLDLPEL